SWRRPTIRSWTAWQKPSPTPPAWRKACGPRSIPLSASGWNGWWPIWILCRVRNSRRSRPWPPKPAPRTRRWRRASRRWKTRLWNPNQTLSARRGGDWGHLSTVIFSESVNSPKAVESFSPAGMRTPGLLFSLNLVPVWIATASFCGWSCAMTITHLDDEPLDTLHPLDLLERAVEANGWAFERAGRDELNLSVAGKWSDHH